MPDYNKHTLRFIRLALLDAAAIIMKPLVALTIFCAANILANAQSGMTFSEFAIKLTPYFDVELINDLEKELPQGAQYRIWSWDVGDFSGDGVPDVAFAIKLLGDKRKQCKVYLFADIDGYLTNVGDYWYNFVDLPLEVGVVIRENRCYVTEKQRQYHWTMRGYYFDGGIVIVADDFTTQRKPNVTLEQYKNYHTLESYEKTIAHKNNQIKYLKQYFTIPCYPRGRQIYRGYTAQASCNTVDYCMSGAFFWDGTDDCSFTVRSVYDDEFLYFTISVRDKNVVTGWCDTCTADRVELWFDGQIRSTDIDTTQEIPRAKKGKLKKVSVKDDSTIYNVNIRLGDFAEKKAAHFVRTSEELDQTTEQALKGIKVAAHPVDTSGYIVKARIPLLLFGISALPGGLSDLTQMRCSVVIHDSDNEFRPEEETTLSTSPVKYMDSNSYSSLLLIPQSMWYGTAKNIYSDQIARTIQEAGF